MTLGYRHVLIATDLAADDEGVLARGIELARHYQAGMTLLHVVEYSSAVIAGDLLTPEDVTLDQERVTQARQQLVELQQRLSVPEARIQVELGVPKHEIVRVAGELGADLIVLGSHGRHGLQLLLGSTANGVLHLAKVDVLAVRVGKT